VSLRGDGKQLQFTGAFCDSVLARLGIRPDLPPGEPPAVQHLGGLKFKVGDRKVEFDLKAMGPYEFNAVLKFPFRDEAERFAASLRTIGVYAEVASDTVRLDSDAFFGLLVYTGATPPGLTPLYRLEEDDFRVYAAVEGGRMRFYFAVRQGGVWKVADGLYGERSVELKRKEREVLEALRGAVAKALEKLDPEWLGRSAEVGELSEIRDKEGVVRTYRLRLFGHHPTPFLEHAVARVEAKPADVRLEGRRVVINTGGVKAEVEFKLLKGKEAEFVLAKDVEETLVLYKSFKEMGLRVDYAQGRKSGQRSLVGPRRGSSREKHA